MHVLCQSHDMLMFAAWFAEYDGLLPQDTELAQKTNVPDVFGATTDDTDGLRIVSLVEVSMSMQAVS